MSKSFYLHCKALHFHTQILHQKCRGFKSGNGQYVSMLFIIPVIVEIAGHRFKIYMLVSEIHDNIDLVLGIKNAFKLEGAYSTHKNAVLNS